MLDFSSSSDFTIFLTHSHMVWRKLKHRLVLWGGGAKRGMGSDHVTGVGQWEAAK